MLNNVKFWNFLVPKFFTIKYFVNYFSIKLQKNKIKYLKI